MTRDQHLEYCRRCVNRKFDPVTGIICGLTGAVAAFQGECADFANDATVTVRVDDETPLTASELSAKLSPEIFDQLKRQQNLPKALTAGVLAAFLCSIVWAAFTVYTTIQFSGMAMLAGAGVGFAMRRAGKGIDIVFGISGSVISLMGCVAGNFLSTIGFLAKENGLGYFETLVMFDYSWFGEVMIATFDIRDIVFYSIAAGAGFALSKKSLTRKDVVDLKAKVNAR